MVALRRRSPEEGQVGRKIGLRFTLHEGLYIPSFWGGFHEHFIVVAMTCTMERPRGKLKLDQTAHGYLNFDHTVNVMMTTRLRVTRCLHLLYNAYTMVCWKTI